MKTQIDTDKRTHLPAGRQGLTQIIILVSGFWLLVTFSLGMVQRPRPKVFIKKYRNGHYQLFVKGKPFIVKGVCYNPIPIGENYDYDWWSDPNKPWIVDGKLMKEMGINTIRFYQPGENVESVRRVTSDLYNLYGIRTILGHWLDFWEYPYPAYGDLDFRERIKKEVLDMVEEFKDEEGLLLWILGNENNYSFSGQVNPWTSDEIEREIDLSKRINLKAKIYYSFVNELAKEIKKIDPHHPVALGNGELRWLDFAKDFCPDIDLVACIVYRGKTFGNLFRGLKQIFDRPLLISEFGADAYDVYRNREDENMQAFFLESQWKEIFKNLRGQGEGNCLGGTIFEWNDEWWKHPDWKTHDTISHWSNGSYYFDIKAKNNLNMNEEWFGIVALSEEKELGVNKRIPRKSYYVLRELWKNSVSEKSKIPACPTGRKNQKSK